MSARELHEASAGFRPRLCPEALISLHEVMMDATKITLVCRDETAVERQWNPSPDADSKLMIAGSADIAPIIAICLEQEAIEIERIVIDRAMDGERFLEFLCELPQEFPGDVLCTKDDGSGFLSASARVTGRSIFALSPDDVRFYLETARLVPDPRATTVNAA